MTAAVARSDDQERRDERRVQVARMTRDGLSAEQIASALGITTRTVQRDRAAAGVAQPAAIPMTDAEHALAATLLADGASYQEVSRTIGRSSTTLARHYPGFAFTHEQKLDRIRLYYLEKSLK